MLGRIFKKKPKKADDTSWYTEDLVLDLEASDREEDDFVLVGQSLYERNVIHARDFQQSLNCVDSSPAYDTVCKTSNMGNSNQAVKQPTSPLKIENDNVDEDCKMLNLCEDVNQSEHAATITTPTILGQNSTSADSIIVKHAYEDIPFQLSPVLRGVYAVSHLPELNGTFGKSEMTDMKKYDYEFTLEKSVLQDCS